MIFNSFTFLLFFLVFFVAYWFAFGKSYRAQNVLIFFCSYLFYGWWDWRFLALLLFSTWICFEAAKLLDRDSPVRVRRMILIMSVFLNFVILFFFKYFNFFLQSWIDLWSGLGIESNVSLLKIVLPVGISFYTFQAVSYIIDVYYRRLEASNNFIRFAAYVSFFPQLVAGPIERATKLLPQFDRRRKFDHVNAVDGLNQILLGFFKKIVVADNAAMFVNKIWQDYDQQTGPTLIIGVVLFAFQIYCDFSGYTDIARGCAKLLGFDLMINFRYPYFSRSIVEFWRRWHISLSTWFRDYVYFPLGGSRVGMEKSIRNVFLIFLISGIWHGANWTFVVWGGINAVFFLPAIFWRQRKLSTEVIAQNTGWSSLKEFLQVLMTFSVVCLGWIFFRSDSLAQAVVILERCLMPGDPFALFFSTNTYRLAFVITGFAIVQLLVIEWVNRRNESVQLGSGLAMPVLFILQICFLGSFKNHFDFIYFQF
jgi:alginate O-acetyltransferase complex protein AlgI